MGDPGRLRATLTDVARHAGVSVSTASNALSGARPVGAAARARVEAAAAALAYEPDRAARSLVSRRSDTIGIVVPDVTNPFFAELGRQLERRLAERGFAALIGDSDNDIERQRAYLTGFEARRVDGLLVVPAVFEDAGRLADVARRTPTVLVDRVVDGWPGSSVEVSQAAGIQGLVEHLADLGHRRIAYVSGTLRASTGYGRTVAFREAVAARGLAAPIVVEAEFTLESGRAAVRRLFDLATTDITAICAADDLLAFAVLEGARHLGLDVPGDVSLTGFDDIPFATFVQPSLTTVRQPITEMSRRAVDLLVDELEGGRVRDRVVLEPALVVRGSTAAPATPANRVAAAVPASAPD